MLSSAIQRVPAPDGSLVLEAQASGDDPLAVGREVAQLLRDLGAQEILDGIKRGV